MDWPELSRWLAKDLGENVGKLAYRTALRVLPLLSFELSKSWQSRNENSTRILNMFRVLLAMRVQFDNSSADLKPVLRDALARLGTVNAFDYVGRTVRAAGSTTVSPLRWTKNEELRKCLQAAKDGTKNLIVASGARYTDKYNLDIWEEVERDTQLISEKKLPFYAIHDERSVGGSWQDFVDILKYYDEEWDPWISWLEFRLFGSSHRLTIQEWKEIEEQICLIQDIAWTRALELNKEFKVLLEKEQHDAEEISEQNPKAITFEVDRTGRVDLDRSADSGGIPSSSDPIYLEVVSAAQALLSEPADNSSALVRDRVSSYSDALYRIHEPSGPALVVMRGASLRSVLERYSASADSLDLPPLTDLALLRLEEIVTSHNVMTGLFPRLAEIDRYRMPAAPNELLDAAEVRRLVQAATDIGITTESAVKTLEEVTDILDSTDVEISAVETANESAKNFIRIILRELWKYKKAIGTAIVATPPALYALGKWALANEAVLTSYAEGSGWLGTAVPKILEWLHTLPLT